MSNPLAEPLYERLLRSFPADQDYTRADWRAEAMPDPIRHYLDHLLRHHSQREARRLHRARTDWVDYDHPEMEQAVRSFFATVENHTQVPRDQWTDTLRTATRRVTTYLVRPVPVLKSFVFNEQTDPLPVSQVRWRMQFFGPYAYLREAVQAYAEKNDQDALEAGKFERVLRRVDRRMTADFDADRWGRLLDPLFETAQRATGREQVPSSLLRSFFDEKNASHLVERLRNHEQESDVEVVTPETLRRLIEETATTEPPGEDHDASPTSAEQFLETSSEPSPEPPLQDEDDSSTSPSPGIPSGDERADEATPLWKRFQQGRPRRKTETDRSEGGDSQPLWMQFKPSRSDPDSTSEPKESTSSSTPQSAPGKSAPTTEHENNLSSLERDVLGTDAPSHRNAYVQNLFQGDEDAYRRVLKRLCTTESWSEASQIIASDVFQTYQVNIYSDTAVHFTNAVEASFQE